MKVTLGQFSGLCAGTGVGRSEFLVKGLSLYHNIDFGVCSNLDSLCSRSKGKVIQNDRKGLLYSL